MPLQDTEHWRSYIKTACEIGLPVMLFIQVVHKVGSSSQVSESDAHQAEAELQAGDGPTADPLPPCRNVRPKVRTNCITK
jgi:hypothetical protein